MTRRPRRRGARAARAALLAGLAVAAALPAAAGARERFDTRVLAKIPAPGFPARAYPAPSGRVYTGTYVNMAGDLQPSRVFEHTGEGTLLRSFVVPGQDLAGETGVQVATSDARGRLVLLDHSPPRALQLDPRSGEFRRYAGFPLVDGAPVVPNYAAWGPDGSLYVTDYAHPVVLRVPPGGGTAVPWLRDARLSGPGFGTTGIVLTAGRDALLIGQQLSPSAGSPVTGGLFRVPIAADGSPGPLTRVWESRAADLADGVALARSGRVYVAGLGPNQLIVLNPDFSERERFPAVPLSGENGSPVPFDTPSSVAFLGTRLIVPNQSQPLGDADHWVLHDVETGEPGLPELIPANAGLTAADTPAARPALRVAVAPRALRVGRRARLRVSVTSAAGGAVPRALVRLGAASVRTGSTGRATIAYTPRAAGTRRVLVTAAGFAAARVTVRVRAR